MTDTHSICLVDGSGYIFRAFYALPSMTRQDGTPINAVYGYVNMLMNLIKENGCEHIVVVFDAKRKNFRNDIFAAYKENRKRFVLVFKDQLWPLIITGLTFFPSLVGLFKVMKDYETLYKIGDIYQKFGDTRSALKYLNDALKQNPNPTLENKIKKIETEHAINKEFYSNTRIRG